MARRSNFKCNLSNWSRIIESTDKEKFPTYQNWFIFMSTNQLYLLYNICHISDDFIGKNFAFHLTLVLFRSKNKQKNLKNRKLLMTLISFSKITRNSNFISIHFWQNIWLKLSFANFLKKLLNEWRQASNQDEK